MDYQLHRLILPKARAHGNEPSRGAKVDAQIQAEEEEELKRKGKAWKGITWYWS